MQIADQIGSTSETVTYDNLDRVATDTSVAGPWSYQYDANGNRTARITSSTTYTQTYASNSNRQTAYNGNTLTTDAAGNLTSTANGTAISYNNSNRMVQYGTSSPTAFSYDSFGQRNSKQGSALIHDAYLPNGRYLMQLQLNPDQTYAALTEYIWLGDMPLAQVQTSYGTNNIVNSQLLSYIHTDHLNAPRAMSNAIAAVVWRWDHDAYGLNAPNQDADQD